MKKDMILGLVRHLLTAAGGYVIAQGLVTEGEATEAVGAIITLAGIIWSAISKRQASKSPDDAITRGPIAVILASALLLSPLALSTGCQTTDTAGRAIVTSSAAVDAALDGWMIYVKSGKASLADEAKVKDAYESYLAAEQAALKVYETAYQAGDKNLALTALETLVAARGDILKLIEQLSGSNAEHPTSNVQR